MTDVGWNVRQKWFKGKLLPFRRWNIIYGTVHPEFKKYISPFAAYPSRLFWCELTGFGDAGHGAVRASLEHNGARWPLSFWRSNRQKISSERTQQRRLFPYRRAGGWKTNDPAKLTELANVTGQLRRSKKNMFLEETAHDNVSGLSWVTASWFLEREIAVGFYKCIFFGALRNTGCVPSGSVIIRRNQTSRWGISPKLGHSQQSNVDG